MVVISQQSIGKITLHARAIKPPTLFTLFDQVLLFQSLDNILNYMRLNNTTDEVALVRYLNLLSVMPKVPICADKLDHLFFISTNQTLLGIIATFYDQALWVSKSLAMLHTRSYYLAPDVLTYLIKNNRLSPLVIVDFKYYSLNVPSVKSDATWLTLAVKYKLPAQTILDLIMELNLNSNTISIGMLFTHVQSDELVELGSVDNDYDVNWLRLKPIKTSYTHWDIMQFYHLNVFPTLTLEHYLAEAKRVNWPKLCHYLELL